MMLCNQLFFALSGRSFHRFTSERSNTAAASKNVDPAAAHVIVKKYGLKQLG